MHPDQLAAMMYESWRVANKVKPLPWDRLNPLARAMWVGIAKVFHRRLTQAGFRITALPTPVRGLQRARGEVYR